MVMDSFDLSMLNGMMYIQSGLVWDKGHDSVTKVFFGDLETLYTYLKTTGDNWLQCH